MMKPLELVPGRQYPILMYGYTGPAGTTASDSWGGFNYLWHLMLTQLGYIVATVDNRGTPAPKGREFRKVIYRQTGQIASADQAAAVRALLSGAQLHRSGPGRSVGVERRRCLYAEPAVPLPRTVQSAAWPSPP